MSPDEREGGSAGRGEPTCRERCWGRATTRGWAGAEARRAGRAPDADAIIAERAGTENEFIARLV